ncbi:hypothetical protein LIA77_02106 [Sarocladium implicatum]|nr:hypothetical protein LIA77_02106 [Sarocladium implicatum]
MTITHPQPRSASNRVKDACLDHPLTRKYRDRPLPSPYSPLRSFVRPNTNNNRSSVHRRLASSLQPPICTGYSVKVLHYKSASSLSVAMLSSYAHNSWLSKCCTASEILEWSLQRG